MARIDLLLRNERTIRARRRLIDYAVDDGENGLEAVVSFTQ